MSDYGVGDPWDLAALSEFARVPLAARILTGTYAGLYLVNMKGGGTAGAFYHVPGTELLQAVGVSVGGLGPPHFPYGLNVEADGPA